jgi:lipopolysaccharide transport system ATP-binding protein
MQETIKIEDLSKQYRLGKVGTGTLSHDLKRWWHLVRGKEDPYLKIGDINDRSTIGSSQYVWALKDINLSIQEGEVLGIIGRNGAGKSTLLKILSKVTGPTTGKITYKGRIGSLLEVGTGFHTELTGRENIYLNGAILGMRRKEIDRKFDEIVDFSGCERYIDTPVKRYSSGMTVRLGFAVAAFLEPEILVVDEVLAVGDAEFQKKAIGKMQDVSKNDGRTVLFVSHNMGSIRALCKTGIYLENGKIAYHGNINKTIELYFDSTNNSNGFINPETDLIQLIDVQIGNQNKKTKAIEYGDTLIVELIIKSKIELDSPCFWIGIRSKFGALFSANSLIDGLRPGKLGKEFTIQYKFPDMKLLPQEYYISCGARTGDGHSAIMTTMEIGSFNMVTSTQELNLKGPMAEKLASESAPILRKYEVSFNNEKTLVFNPDELC